MSPRHAGQQRHQRQWSVQLAEHCDDLVWARTQLINGLHVLLVKLIPSGVARGLSAESAAQALRGVRPRDTPWGARSVPSPSTW